MTSGDSAAASPASAASPSSAACPHRREGRPGTGSFGPTHGSRAAIVTLLAVFSIAVGVLVGGVGGLASSSLAVLGLWESAAGLVGAWCLTFAVAWADCRAALVHAALAACWAIAATAGLVAADAWLLRVEVAEAVAATDIAASDAIVLRGHDERGRVADDELRVATGAAGIAGAARLRLQGGLVVLRAPGRSWVVAMPAWAQAAVRGLLAAWIAWLAARALATWRGASRCPRCGGPTRVERRGYADAAACRDWRERHAHGALAAEDLLTGPALAARPMSDTDCVVEADHCVRGCPSPVFAALARARGRRFGGGVPGRLIVLPTAATDQDVR